MSAWFLDSELSTCFAYSMLIVHGSKAEVCTYMHTGIYFCHQL